MTIDIFKGRRVYIELTNPVHGGEGWDFGEVLWSPAKDILGKDRWKTLKEIKPGDIIFHSVKPQGKEHILQGTSIVKAQYKQVDIEPVIPGRWKGYGSYLRVSLQSYSPFSFPMKLLDFLSSYKDELAEIGIFKSFYTSDYGIAQKYIAEVPSPVVDLLCGFIKQQGNILFGDIQYEDDTDSVVPGASPARIQTITCRVVRDTKIIRELKANHHNMCQI